jgi:hypothetical protein
MLGQFVGGVNQAEKGTPGIFMGLGNVSQAYNAQKFNQYQQMLSQKQNALEEQQRREYLAMNNQLARAQGIDPLAGENGGMVTSPDDYRKSNQYIGGVYGHQAEQRYTQGQGFNPQAGAVVDSAFMGNLQKYAKDNADRIETLGRMPGAAKDGYAGAGLVPVPVVSTSPVPQGGGVATRWNHAKYRDWRACHTQ